MINKKILDILYDDAYSGDALPRYSGFSEEKSDEQFRKKLHNKLATNAMNAQQAANEEAEKINNEWTPKFQKISKFGKIRDGFFNSIGNTYNFSGNIDGIFRSRFCSRYC